jgi:hypothetical protein
MLRRRRNHHAREPAPHPLSQRGNRSRFLLVIDNRPLQASAWAALVAARKRLDKATREVHRHEETDEPAFRSWLAATFPTLISAVRELALQVEAKTRIVDAVESEAYFTGRSAARIWREWQRGEGPRSSAPDGDPRASQGDQTRDRAGAGFSADADAAFDEEMRQMFEDAGIPGGDPFADAFRDFGRAMLGVDERREKSSDTGDARTIYRRLVQQLHPDRGGQWTPARARLWENVQAAWAGRDADWLSRLEAEWEAAADLLGPTSAVGRLRAACTEIDAARRDAERRVRAYRKQAAWRFSLRPPPENLRQQIECELRRDESMLRNQLDSLEDAIAGWQRASTRKAPKRRPVKVAWQDDMPLF